MLATTLRRTLASREPCAAPLQDGDNGDNHDDDHGDNHSDDDGNDHKQETPPRLLQDHAMGFQD